MGRLNFIGTSLVTVFPRLVLRVTMNEIVVRNNDSVNAFRHLKQVMDVVGEGEHSV